MKRPRLTLGLALVLLVGVGVYVYVQSRPYHFLVVREGVLYRSGTLPPDDLEKVIKEHGIKTVVNLRHDPDKWPQAEEKRVTEQLGASFLDLPLQPETPPNAEELAVWLKLLDDPARLPILVHCQHGVTRTGMFVAVYEIEKERRDNKQVLEDLEFFGHKKWADYRKPFRDFVLNYQPRWRTAPSAAPAGAAPAAPK